MLPGGRELGQPSGSSATVPNADHVRRFVPRNYKQHSSQAAAERERLEHDLDIRFHSSDKLDALNGIDMIRTEGGQ